MAASNPTPSDEAQIRDLLERWAASTREGRLDDVLANHSPSLLIFDVLPPMQYESAAAYRKSWGDWQPEVGSEGIFALEDLTVRASADVAFAHALIRCGGVFPDGKRFEDLVRATFCLTRNGDRWTVAHQHVSKPFGPKGSAA